MLIPVRWMTPYLVLVSEAEFATACAGDPAGLACCAEFLSAEFLLASIGRLHWSVMSLMTPRDHKIPLRSAQILSANVAPMLSFLVLGTVVGLTIVLRATSDLESEA